MRSCLATLVFLVLVFPTLGASFSTMAASGIDQKSTTEDPRPVEECKMGKAARDAIDAAVLAISNKVDRTPKSRDLIYQAIAAAGPPECNSIRATILADEAKRLSDATPEPSEFTIASGTSETFNDDQPIFSLYDGAWEFGLSWEVIRLKDSSGQSFSDDAVSDFNYGLHVGKEFFRTENWFLGGQVHIIHSNEDEILFSDDIAFDATSIFVTARPESLPALQFKLGITDAEYENINGHESGTGLAYGVAIVTGHKSFRFHWLDYEVYKIGDDEFKSWSLSILIVICFLAALGNASCG